MLPYGTDLEVQQAVKKFVLRYFELCQCECHEIEPSVYRVELTPEHYAELAGGTMPPPSLAPHLYEDTTLWMTFDEALLSKYPQAEYVTRGSKRMQSILEIVKARGSLSWCVVCPKITGLSGTSVTYHPVWLVVFRLTHRIEPRLERMVDVAVDMVDGRSGTNVFPVLKHWRSTEDVPSNRRRRQLSFKELYRRMQTELITHLACQTPEWAENAARQLEEMQGFLKHHFSFSEDKQSEEPMAEMTLRLQELTDRFEPQLLVDPLRAVVVFAPVCRLTARHPLLDASKHPERHISPDPV